jgi:hypothetical protein
MNPSAGDLCTWSATHSLVRDSKRRPVWLTLPPIQAVLRSWSCRSPRISSRSLPLRLVIEATPVNALAADSLAFCDQTTCLLVSPVAERFICWIW